MTQKELSRLCNTWQRRLRLSDWRTTIRIVPVSEMQGCIGHAEIDEDEQAAEIRIREDAPVEPTIVHELIHIRLIAFSDGDESEPRHAEREVAINLLADCYVAAYPRRRKAE